MVKNKLVQTPKYKTTNIFFDLRTLKKFISNKLNLTYDGAFPVIEQPWVMQ